jgi:hypothetical protein
LEHHGATHFRLISAGLEVDFEASYIVKISIPRVASAQTEAAVTLTNAVTPASTKPLFVAFGIDFSVSQWCIYPLKNGVYNALALVAVDGCNGTGTDQDLSLGN